MILLFLGSWRSTLIIAVSIPLSVLSSLAILSVLGQTINIMTLGGLALAVGILVDDATVTIENVERHIASGEELDDSVAVPGFLEQFGTYTANVGCRNHRYRLIEGCRKPESLPVHAPPSLRGGELFNS